MLKEKLCLHMKTLVIDGRLWNSSSGIGSFLDAILKVFEKKNRFSIRLLCYASEQKKSPFPTIVMKSALYTLHEQIELKQKIPKCTLFWSPHINVPLFSIKAEKRMATIHDTYHLEKLASSFWFKKKGAKMLYRTASLRSDYLTTISTFSERRIRHFFPQTKAPLKVIPLGPKAIFYPRGGEGSVQKKYALPKEYLLLVTNFKEHKNVERMLEAAEGILPCVIVGGPAKKEGYHLGNVSDEELAFLYSNAKGLLFASLYEGFGLPPLEAMACKCPVIISNEASLPEVCGEAAERVDAYSVPSIRRGILNILHEVAYREELIEKGYQLASKRKLEDSAEEFYTFISEIL